MNRTRNNQPRTPSPLGLDTSNKENKKPQPLAGQSQPSGQHSPLVRRATMNEFLNKKEQTLFKGHQTADDLLKDPQGLEIVKDKLLAVGLVLEHDRGKKTVSAVPVQKFFERTAAAKYPSPSTDLTMRRLARNAGRVATALDDIVSTAEANEPLLNRAQIARAEDAYVLLTAFCEDPVGYTSELSRNPALLNLATRAATHIGVSLIYVPDREAPLAVKPLNFEATIQAKTQESE